MKWAFEDHSEYNYSPHNYVAYFWAQFFPDP